MRLFSLTLLLSAVTVAAVAETTDSQKQVVEANRAWFDVFVKVDVARLEQMETDDFVFIQDGQLVDKSTQVQGLRKRAGKPLEQTHTVDVHKAVVDGNIVVLTGFNTIRSGKRLDR